MSRSKIKVFGVGSRVGNNSEGFYGWKVYDDTIIYSISSVENAILLENLRKIHAHSNEKMHELPDNRVHLIVTSPPYKVGKEVRR